MGQAAGSTTAKPEEVEEEGKKSLSEEVARPPGLGTPEASGLPLAHSRTHDGATCQLCRNHKNKQMTSEQCKPGARMTTTENRIL